MRKLLLLAALGALMVGCQNAATEAPRATTTATATATPAAAAPAPTVAAAPAVTPAAPRVALAPLIDQVTPGDDTGETAHNQKGDNTETGEWNGRTYRHSQGGWFSWDLKVDPSQPVELWVTYAGVDRRTFRMLVDGTNMNIPRQTGNDAEDFYDQKYAVPETLTKGKQKITVRFEATNQTAYAGGVFGIKTMRASAASAPAPKAP